MRNRQHNNGHPPQQHAHEPVMVTSPETVPGLQADVQRLQASAEENGNQAAEHRRLARQATETANGARGNIERLQQALTEETARLQQAETTQQHQTAQAEEREHAAQATLARADDLRRIITSLGAPTPAPPDHEPARATTDVELVSSRSGEYPTAPAHAQPQGQSPLT